MQYEKVNAKSLTPYPKNPKWHSNEQVEAIAGSIKEFQFLNVVVIDENGMILKGHASVKAAIEAGMEDVPCLRVTHLTESQKKAFILADNRLAELGSGWDSELVQSELQDIDFEELKHLELDDLGFEMLFAEAPAPATPPAEPTEPVIGDGVVNPEDLEKAGGNVGIDTPPAKQIKVMCPECGCEFLIDEK